MILRKGNVGEQVKVVQQRLVDLGYLNGKVDGIYGTQTERAVLTFQSIAKLKIDGIYGPQTEEALFKDDAPIYTPPKESDEIKEMDWFKSAISKIFSKGTVATVTDCRTGLTWQEKRRGGSNHADVEPCTADDTAILKQAYGGSWSWNRRPIIVTIDGIHYAASMNGMPHSGQSITTNNFNGHHCIHFTNSKNHNTGKADANHQKAVKEASLYRGFENC